jgi:hypothetical protein
MFCPSCGHEIPDASRFCLLCGKSPSASIQATTSKSAPAHKPKSNLLRNSLLGLILILSFYLAAQLVSNANGGRLPGSGRKDPLTPAAFRVRPGEIYFFRFTVQHSGRVVGRFQVTGAQGNDIEAVIADADNFENWKNGHAAHVLYESGVTTTGNINVPVAGPGTYYLGFSNKFSLFAAKDIGADIQLNQ